MMGDLYNMWIQVQIQLGFEKLDAVQAVPLQTSVGFSILTHPPKSETENDLWGFRLVGLLPKPGPHQTWRSIWVVLRISLLFLYCRDSKFLDANFFKFEWSYFFSVSTWGIQLICLGWEPRFRDRDADSDFVTRGHLVVSRAFNTLTTLNMWNTPPTFQQKKEGMQWPKIFCPNAFLLDFRVPKACVLQALAARKEKPIIAQKDQSQPMAALMSFCKVSSFSSLIPRTCQWFSATIRNVIHRTNSVTDH